MYRIVLAPSAVDDIAWFRKPERMLILDGIEEQLTHQPDVDTRNRKRLRPNQVAEWELRIGRYRVFYDVSPDENRVEVRAVGHKEGNVLRVRGEEYRL